MPNLDAALQSSVSYEEITVDYLTKQITVPSSLSTAGVRGDANGRRLHFRFQKVPDEVDLLATGSSIEIWYENADGETGRYFVQDAAADGDEVTFSFPIPATLTKSSGTVRIEVCVSNSNKHWHVSPASMTIGEYFDAEEITTDDPKYDVIAQLYSLVSGGTDTSGFLTTTTGDERYRKKTDPIVLTDAQKAELKGEKGDSVTGPKGEKGDTPVITGTKSGKVLTIKADGVSIGTVSDGEDGSDGSYGGVIAHEMATTDTTVTLNPNEYYFFPTMASLTVSLGTSESGVGVVNEYHFVFSSGTTATTLSLPSAVKIPEGYSIEASKTYEVSIVKNLALISEWT